MLKLYFWVRFVVCHCTMQSAEFHPKAMKFFVELVYYFNFLVFCVCHVLQNVEIVMIVHLKWIVY